MRRPGRILIGAVVALFIVLIFGRSVAVFYTDVLWFEAVGHGDVFWKRLFTTLSVRAITGGLGAALILLNLWYVLRQLGPVHLRRRYGNIEIAEQVPRAYLIGGALLVAVLAGWWLSGIQFGGNMPVALLAWLSGERWGVPDPLFGRDVAFYVFTLPILTRLLDYLFIVLIWSGLLVGIGYVLVGAVRILGNRLRVDDRPRVHFAFLAAAALLIFAIRFFLGRYMLLIEGGGFGGAIGYTDVYARLPARLVLAVLAAALAVALVQGAIRRSWIAPLGAAVIFILTAIGMGAVYPAVVQKIRVEPNQLGSEREYIRWNLEFTRLGFGLDRIDRRPFTYRRAGAADWNSELATLQDLPLWDPGPLQTLFNAVESHVQFYHFPDVDFDRYGGPGDRRQVAIGVREFTREGLSEANRTWQSLHLNPIYTRGLGVVAVPGDEHSGGVPTYWLNELPPVHRNPLAPASLELTEPSVYFGETMLDYAVVGHGATFMEDVDDALARVPDVPTVTTGIPLGSLARVLAFAWRFGDQNLLFARDLGSGRMVFRRSIRERLATIAPFLLWDDDPYPIVAGGRVVWMIDGYTASSNFPASRPFPIPDVGSLNYMRSSVKATVDGVTGEVAIYAMPEPDALLRAYSAVFPGLVREWSSMPEELTSHLRYPPMLFRVQADALEEYHLERAELFYAGQGVWQLPQDIAPVQRRRFQPGFVTAPLPGSDDPEFLLVQPFNARDRQNMTALLVARSDPPHHGELILLELPGEDQIRGPLQVQSVIEQDPFISQQLSLWRAAGSTVELGRLRVIPTDSSILYVEPLFLAAQTSSLPQLQRVIVSDGIAVAMEETLEAAVAALAGETPTPTTMDTAAGEGPDPGQAAVTPTPPGLADAWSRRALELVRQADALLRAGDLAGFGAVWAELRALLEQQAGAPPPR
jgi:uncharacterized protein